MTKHNHNTNSRDPLGSQAAADFYRHSELERALKYGKQTMLACFTPRTMTTAEIEGEYRAATRQDRPSKKTATVCAANCGHFECRQRCSLHGQFN